MRINKPDIFRHGLKAPLMSIFKHAHVEVNASTRMVTHYISADKKNHYDQILPVKGYDDSGYRKNPVVLFNHGFTDCFSTTPAKNQLEFLIGNNASISIAGEFLEANTAFLNEGVSPVADDVFRLYESKNMHGWSKWFYPIGEPKYEPDLDAVIYPNWGIHEYSAVFIPVDGEAIGNETNRLHALSLVKSPSVQNAINTHATKNEIVNLLNNDTDLQEFKNQIESFKQEIESLKSKDNTADINKIAQHLLQSYNNILTPKLEAFKNRFIEIDKQLLDLAKNNTSAVQAIVETHFLKLVKETMGKV